MARGYRHVSGWVVLVKVDQPTPKLLEVKHYVRYYTYVAAVRRFLLLRLVARSSSDASSDIYYCCQCYQWQVGIDNWDKHCAIAYIQYDFLQMQSFEPTAIQ